jgi:hypothetical protein
LTNNSRTDDVYKKKSPQGRNMSSVVYKYNTRE